MDARKINNRRIKINYGRTSYSSAKRNSESADIRRTCSAKRSIGTGRLKRGVLYDPDTVTNPVTTQNEQQVIVASQVLMPSPYTYPTKSYKRQTNYRTYLRFVSEPATMVLSIGRPGMHGRLSRLQTDFIILVLFHISLVLSLELLKSWKR